MSRFRALAASAVAGAALAAVAFGAAGGTDLSRTTITEVVVVLVAGCCLALAALRPASGRAPGTVPLVLFAGLTAITALSSAWSIAPSLSLEETSRTFAYLAVFATALVAARLAPGATPAALGGVLLGAVAVCGWALATRVWPGALAEEVLGARLGDPLGYSNALAAVAATGVPAALWLGARREGGAVSAALAYPALGLLLLTMLLTQSRGGLVAAAAVAALWLILVPLRLRTVPVIAVAALAVAPVAAWALSKDAFTEALQDTAAREAVAGDFGLMTVAMLVALLAAGLMVSALSARRAPSLPLRRRAGLVLAVVACALPLVALTSVAGSDRGLGGTLSDRFDDLTADEAPPEGGARLSSVSSSRAGYWRQARDVLSEEPALGTGAGTFRLASLRHRGDSQGSRHAHGFVAQTMADLGVVGLVVVLALLAAWLASAARSTGFLPRGRPRPAFPPERAAVCALALCATAFGLQSLVDWTWFVPGAACLALAAAGFVAGRGPLRPVGAPPEPREREAAPSRLAGLVPAQISAGRAVGAAAVLVTALLSAWAVWQPERASRASERAFQAVESGDLPRAAREAERARDVDPYSPEPLFATATVLAAQGRTSAAYRTLERAVIEHPRDPEPWLALGRFELQALDLPGRALETAQATFVVDPSSRQAVALRESARRALNDPSL